MITTLEREITAWKSEYRIDGNSLAFYRILFCVVFGLVLAPSYSWIGEVPKAFYDPPLLSFAALFDTFPAKSFFQFLDAVIRISLVLVALGFFTRVATGTLLVALLVGNNFQYSFGKIDHSVFILCVLFVMLVVNWGQSLSIDQMLYKRQWQSVSSIWLLAVFLAFGFFSAGLGKAVSWLDFNVDTNGFLRWLYSGYYTLDRRELLAPTAISIRPLWIWEFADIIAVVFELGFMVALLRRRVFVAWLLLACFFHLSNCLFLNLPFTAYSICYLVFVPWSKLIPQVATLDRLPLWGWIAIGCTMVMIGPPFNLFRILSSPSWALERGTVAWIFTSVIFTVVLWNTRPSQTSARQNDLRAI